MDGNVASFGRMKTLENPFLKRDIEHVIAEDIQALAYSAEIAEHCSSKIQESEDESAEGPPCYGSHSKIYEASGIKRKLIGAPIHMMTLLA